MTAKGGQTDPLSTRVALAIVRYCADEVERQHAPPGRVYDMILAWKGAMDLARKGQRPTIASIRDLGTVIEPIKNVRGYRTVDLMVGDSRVAVRPEQVVPQLVALLVAVDEGRLNADEAYREFELIHPFRDGNGRTGKVLFNWWAGTLDNPQMPTNWFNVLNP